MRNESLNSIQPNMQNIKSQLEKTKGTWKSDRATKKDNRQYNTRAKYEKPKHNFVFTTVKN